MDRKALSDIARKKRVFAYAEQVGNIAKSCRYFGISRETFYKWKKQYALMGDEGLCTGLRRWRYGDDESAHDRKSYSPPSVCTGCKGQSDRASRCASASRKGR